MLGFYRAHRAEPFQRITSDPFIEFTDLSIIKAGVRLGYWSQFVFLPHCKGVIGKQRCAAPVARLRINHDGINR